MLGIQGTYCLGFLACVYPKLLFIRKLSIVLCTIHSGMCQHAPHSASCTNTSCDCLSSHFCVTRCPKSLYNSGWNAPSTWNDIIFRLDSTTGCGDLMFSSHTIFTMVFVCVIFKYFNWTFMKRVMIFLQITIVPFIVASHKHYSVDVFTALYVTPLVFEILWTRFPDKDLSSTDLANHYGIRFYLTQTASGDGYAYVVNVWGREFYVEMDDLPVDLNYKRTDKMDSGTKRLRPSSAEVSPLIV
mmetsp:Transcript_8661/g.11462  ORF Transcript_8661/g.11462 Transcript_8661/m.11462 type:complete len:243 (-) Transcript_8661:965-1693(-)